MAEYTDLLPDEIDPTSIEEEVYEFIQTRWPEWQPADGELAVWIIKALAFRLSELNETAVDVADEIFARYGEMRGIPRFDASPAVANSTWTFISDEGFTIAAGTEVSIPISGNESILFEVASEVLVPNGQSTATVPLSAQEPGTAGNGLTGNASLVDALNFVEEILLDEPTHGGLDEEDIGQYLTRLKERLEVATETPIIPRDFEIIARTYFTFVGRAVARDGWDPVAETDDNERMISQAHMGPDGEPITPEQKTEVKQLIESLREVNFEFHPIDADYTEIDVEYEIGLLPGFEMGPVRSAVDQALAEYFSPANWGLIPGMGMTPASFGLQPIVRYLEVASEIDRVPGVDYVDSLKIAKDGDALDTDNLTLDGAVPLTRPGDFTAP